MAGGALAGESGAPGQALEPPNPTGCLAGAGD